MGIAFAAPAAHAQPTAQERAAAARAIAQAVVAEIPGAHLRSGLEGIDPLFNVPELDALVAGRAEVMMDPDFWVGAVSALLEGGAIVLPAPIDVVKPEAFLPTAPIATGPVASALPRRDRDLSKVTYEWRGKPKTIRQFLRTTETDVVAFAREGEIIADFYENGWSSDVPHQPWSVTKSFISAVVGIAVGEGLVRSVQDPVDAYVAELKGTAWEGVTIQNLLQMESGVHWDEETPVLAVNTQVQQWVQAALDLVTEGQLGQGRNEFLKSLPRFAEQGTVFKYNSGNTQVLAWLTEEVYGKPFNQVIEEKLWKPAGMEAGARILTDRVGDAIASQGLYSRVFDLARFGELFRLGGRTPEGVRVVPEAWVTESTQHTELSEGRYAYQWWAGPTDGSYEASGFQGQKISVSPGHCLVGVRLSHAFGGDTRPSDGPLEDPASYGFATEFHSAEWQAMYRAVAEHLGTCERAGSGPAALRLSVRRALSRRGALKRKALRVRASAPGGRTAARIRAIARVRRGGEKRQVVVASRRVTLRPGAPRAIRVPLTRAGRAWLRSVRRGAVRVRVTAPGHEPVTRRLKLR